MVGKSNANPATPVKKASAPAKRSPGKSNKPIPKKALKNNNIPSISVINFGPPFAFEIYWYEKNDNDDGFTHGIMKQIRGEGPAEHKLFDTANFVEVLTRREPGTADVALKNRDNNYDRRLFLRYPNEGASTPATRESGLQALKAFLKDKTFSLYPPSDIDVRDLTNYEDRNPLPMDNFMMNKDINTAIKQACDEDDLDADFKDNFPDCAKSLWQSSNVGEFGTSLGF